MTINEKIKQRRLQLGLNANDVAEALGISRATLYRYESHEIEKLPISTIEPLADILGTTPIELMGWNEPGFSGTKKIPLVGTIACGSPILAEENIEASVTATLYLSIPSPIAATVKSPLFSSAKTQRSKGYTSSPMLLHSCRKTASILPLFTAESR